MEISQKQEWKTFLNEGVVMLDAADFTLPCSHLHIEDIKFANPFG